MLQKFAKYPHSADQQQLKRVSLYESFAILRASTEPMCTVLYYVGTVAADDDFYEATCRRG